MQKAARMPHSIALKRTNEVSVCCADCPFHFVPATRRMFSGLQFLSPRASILFRVCFRCYVWRLLEPLDGVGVLDGLDGFALCFAAGHELEGCLVAKVSEGLAWSPTDVYVFDVGRAEFFGCLCADGLESGLEVAHVAEAYALALEHEFAQAAEGDGEKAHDVAFPIYAAVGGNVFGKLVDVEHFAMP